MRARAGRRVVRALVVGGSAGESAAAERGDPCACAATGVGGGGVTAGEKEVSLGLGKTGNALGEDFSEPGTVGGIKGTPASAELTDDFRNRLLEVDPNLVDFSYSAETYDAIVITALATIIADTDDPAAVARELNGVTRDGEACESFEDCVALIEDGQDIDYNGPSGPQEFSQPGEPTAASFAIMSYGEDNQIEQRSAINTCNRGNTSIYPVDARGLTAVVAGGGASSRGGSGTSLFTGANALRGFNQLSQSQEALTTLADKWLLVISEGLKAEGGVAAWVRDADGRWSRLPWRAGPRPPRAAALAWTPSLAGAARWPRGAAQQEGGDREDRRQRLPHAAAKPGISLASAQKPCTCPTTLNGIFTRATGPAATSLVSIRIRSERPASLVLLPMPIR